MPWGLFAQTNNLPADQVLEMGQTNKSQVEFENYLRTINHLYTQQTYDLINNNCNNFADTICQYLTGHGIPSYIIDLPRTVFSSPGGAFLRPIIDGIQNNIRQQSGHGLDPFQQPSPQSFESSLSDSVRSLAMNALQNTATQPSLANLEEFPLISGDASTVVAVGSKILNLAGPDGIKGSALSAEEKASVQTILEKLSQAKNSSETASGKVLKADFGPEDYALMERVLSNHPEAHMSVLFVIRLMFLHDKITDFNRLTIVREIISRLLHRLGDQTVEKQVNPFATVPAHVMALCAISNLLSHDTGKAYLLGENTSLESSNFVGDLVDVALSGMANSRTEVRQMSATLAYNLTLACTRNNQLSGPWKEADANPSEMNGQALQLFCGAFEGLAEEKVRGHRYLIPPLTCP